jgi:hypothetical protein
MVDASAPVIASARMVVVKLIGLAHARLRSLPIQGIQHVRDGEVPRAVAVLVSTDPPVASWHPIDLQRLAMRVGGSPFKTFVEAEKACESFLGHLTK